MIGRRPEAAVIFTGFVVALLVRVAYLLSFRDSPFYALPMVDAAWHDAWAWGVVQGTWSMEGHAFFRAPLYPFWLAALYSVLGHSVSSVLWIQAVVGAVGVGALAGAAARMAGRRAGFAAAGIAALYGPLVFFDGELLIPNLLVTLLCGTLYFAAGARGRTRPVVASLLLGLAVIARPNVVVLLPVLLLWLARGGGARRGLAASAALMLLPALVVTGINWKVEGTPVFVASQGGVNFYAGNHAGASGRSVEIPQFADHRSWREFPDATFRVPEEAVGRSLNSQEVSNWWMHQGFDWWRDAPGDALQLTAAKAYTVINAFEVPNNRDLYFERPRVLQALLWKTSFFAFPWGLVFPLAVMGLWVALATPRLRTAGLALGLWFVFYAGSIVPFFVTARFRMGLVPVMILLAAIALSRVRSVPRGAWIAGLLALVLCNTAGFDVREQNPALEWARLAEAYAQTGRVAESVELLERAHREDPKSATFTAMLARQQFQLGVSLLEQEQYADAVSVLQGTIQLAPSDAAAWVNLGVAREGVADSSGALEAYTRGIRLAPFESLGSLRLAELHLAAGRAAAAVEVLEPAVDRLQTSFELRFLLATAYARLEQYDRALEEIDTCLHLRVDDPQALQMQRWLNEQLER